jgi:AraC-like DNA-binding protein
MAGIDTQTAAMIECDLTRPGYWLNRGQAGGTYPELHRHPGFELIWVERGQGECVTAKRSKTFCAGNALLIDGSTEHALRVYGGSFVRTLAHFNPAILGHPVGGETTLFADAPAIGVLKVELCAAAQARANGWIEAMFGELRAGHPGRSASIAAYLQLLLVEFHRHRRRGACPCLKPGIGEAHPHLVGAVLWHIEHHLAGSIPLDRLARELSISQRHLERSFRATTGRSIKAFWTERRLEQAAAYLDDDRVTVREAARRVGYASPFAFSRAFKRHFGVPPSTVQRGSGPRS